MINKLDHNSKPHQLLIIFFNSVYLMKSLIPLLLFTFSATLWAGEVQITDPLWDLQILPPLASQNIKSGRPLLKSETHEVGHGFTFGSQEKSKGKFFRVSAKKRDVVPNKDFMGVEMRTNLPFVKLVIKTKSNTYYMNRKGVEDCIESKDGIYYHKALFSGMLSKDFDYFPLEEEITALFIEAPLFDKKSALIYNLTYFGERAQTDTMLSSAEPSVDQALEQLEVQVAKKEIMAESLIEQNHQAQTL
jgi:hypothetical protein